MTVEVQGWQLLPLCFRGCDPQLPALRCAHLSLLSLLLAYTLFTAL